MSSELVKVAWEELQVILKDVWERFRPEEKDSLSKGSAVSVAGAVEGAMGQDVAQQVQGLKAIAFEFAWMGKNRAYNAFQKSALNALWRVGGAAFKVA